jgi:hypothetical protein
MKLITLLLETKNLGTVSIDFKNDESIKKAFNELLDKCVSTLPDFKEEESKPVEKGVYNLDKNPTKPILVATVSLQYQDFSTMRDKIKNIDLYLSPFSDNENRSIVKGNSIYINRKGPGRISPDDFKNDMKIGLQKIIYSILHKQK